MPKKILILLFSFLIILFLYYLNLLKPIERIYTLIFHPVQKELVSGAKKTNNAIKASLTKQEDLIQEINALRLEINDLKSDLLELERLEKENMTLREMLDFKKSTNNTLIMAEVISKRNYANEKSLIINKGAKAGIKEGDASIIGKGTFIGKVIKISEERALIQLTIDNKSTILATLSDSSTTIAGILRGGQGNSLELSEIPKDIQLAPQQKVITNGLQDRIPSNLYLGEIVKLQESENEIFNAAVIEPPYRIENITVVGVLTS